jgi:hypothetical protein
MGREASRQIIKAISGKNQAWVKAFRERLRHSACNRWHRAIAMQRPQEGERPMFIFNRPLLAVVMALTVPALLVLLNEVINFSTI